MQKLKSRKLIVAPQVSSEYPEIKRAHSSTEKSTVVLESCLRMKLSEIFQ